VQTRKVAASFEPLNSSLPLSAPGLRVRKATCNPVVLAQKSLKPTGYQSVNCKNGMWTEITICRFKTARMTQV